MSYRRLDDLDRSLWRAVVELYISDPLTHCYLMYDLIYELENIDAVFRMRNGVIDAYVLLWRGPHVYGVHLWGSDIDLLKRVELPRDVPTYIHLYTDDRRFAEKVIEIAKDSRSVVRAMEFLDMVTDEKSFRPYNPEAARRLGEEDLDAFLEIKRVQGREIDREDARKAIARGRYYGVYVDGKLAAIAGRYIVLPEVWVIGDVYVRPEYRGRGYGKIVTSAITRDAIVSGATPLLHVDTENTPAVRLYHRLGYRVLRKRIWLYIEPH